jgi:hypothetical protein
MTPVIVLFALGALFALLIVWGLLPTRPFDPLADQHTEARKAWLRKVQRWRW